MDSGQTARAIDRLAGLRSGARYMHFIQSGQWRQIPNLLSAQRLIDVQSTDAAISSIARFCRGFYRCLVGVTTCHFYQFRQFKSYWAVSAPAASHSFKADGSLVDVAKRCFQ